MSNLLRSLSLTALLSFSLIQPAPAKVMLGAYLTGDGWDVEEIKKFNEHSAKELAFVTFFSAFSHNWREHLKWQTSNIYSTGAIPLISWMPVDVDEPDRNLLPEIAAGDWDDYIDTWIDGLLSWLASYPESKRPMILLRFGHEFNALWYPYSGDPDSYVVAWRRIHDRFQRAGANEFVEWVWNSNHISFDNHNDITKYYPGDQYVDWTALDGYNWGTNHDWTNWDDFEYIFAAAYDTLITNYPDKPILIAEYGSPEPKDLPNESWGQRGSDVDKIENRSEWFFDMLQTIKEHFPAIRGISLFNNNKELSWSLTNEQSTGLVGFNLGLQSDHYTSHFLCARVMPPDPSLPQASPVEIQDGPTKIIPREQLNPEVFSHAINTRKPPKEVISIAEDKSRYYRHSVRAQSINLHESIAAKELEFLNY